MNVDFLRVTGVTKRFGGFTAVSECSLGVAEGRITGLIGPNGAGKTTLFNCISGFTPVDEGRIAFRGEEIAGLPAHRIARRGLARTFQVPHGFRELTVMENLMAAPTAQAGERISRLLLRPGRCREEERRHREKALGLLETIGLADRRNETVANLTTGEARMLELARQLMLDPHLVLLDEPAAGVNPSVQDVLGGFILDLCQGGLTFLIIDHNLEFITRLSHHIYVMNAGEIFFEGAPREVMANEEVRGIYLGRVA